MEKAKIVVAGLDTFKRGFAALLIIAGLIGLFASFELTLDKIAILKDPGFQPICNINPIFSCSSVMKSSQSEIGGIPNSLFGIVGFTATIVTGVAILAGTVLKRWFWLAFNIGQLAALGLVLWLFTQSIYELGTICLFCMATWFTTVPIFWYATVFNLREGHIVLPQKLRIVSSFILRHHGDILAVFFVIIIGIIMNEFWYYWETFLP